MRIYEILAPGSNPTITPKSSEFTQSNSLNLNNAPQLSAKDKAVTSIVKNHKKNMIDRKTAEKQLKGQGMQDNEIASYLDMTNQTEQK